MYSKNMNDVKNTITILSANGNSEETTPAGRVKRLDKVNYISNHDLQALLTEFLDKHVDYEGLTILPKYDKGGKGETSSKEQQYPNTSNFEEISNNNGEGQDMFNEIVIVKHPNETDVSSTSSTTTKLGLLNIINESYKKHQTDTLRPKDKNKNFVNFLGSVKTDPKDKLFTIFEKVKNL